jgi:hypothetical protein
MYVLEQDNTMAWLATLEQIRCSHNPGRLEAPETVHGGQFLPATEVACSSFTSYISVHLLHCSQTASQLCSWGCVWNDNHSGNSWISDRLLPQCHAGALHHHARIDSH